MINFRCFKPQRLWPFVTAATGYCYTGSRPQISSDCNKFWALSQLQLNIPGAAAPGQPDRDLPEPQCLHFGLGGTCVFFFFFLSLGEMLTTNYVSRVSDSSVIRSLSNMATRLSEWDGVKQWGAVGLWQMGELTPCLKTPTLGLPQLPWWLRW